MYLSARLLHHSHLASFCGPMQAPPPFDLLPDELVIHIMQSCTPAALAKCEVVCRRWRNCLSTGSSAVWLLKTKELWGSTGWVYNVSTSRSLSERLSCISAASMRRALSRYDTAGLTEKSEWTSMLRAMLLWEQDVCTWSQRGWIVPRWAISMDDGKAAYLFARREIARDVPLQSELSRQKWDLLYNLHPIESFEVEFFDSSQEMSATSHPGARFRWTLQGGAKPGLQVENFPLHTFSRASDGRWVIANQHVCITQKTPPSGDPPVM